MRLRTGHSPNDWSDNVPAIHVPRPGHGIRGNTTSGYIPFAVLPMIQSTAEKERQHRRLAAKNVSHRPLCGDTMKMTGEVCARMAGHRDSHRSRAVMDADMRGRRCGDRKPWIVP